MAAERIIERPLPRETRPIKARARENHSRKKYIALFLWPSLSIPVRKRENGPANGGTTTSLPGHSRCFLDYRYRAAISTAPPALDTGQFYP